MDAREWVAKAFEEFPVREASVTTDVVLAMATINVPRQDPGDAFLAATAKVFNLILVTADSRLLATKGIPLPANR